ncbi:mitochondrial, Probable 3-hydroxyisobutyrate dehydrogenase [Lucilia cuprina]|nr:mitochondrial, Probable 3-hydroxyisobutyrate dehydrogenase [Lucilia cuprina]
MLSWRDLHLGVITIPVYKEVAILQSGGTEKFGYSQLLSLVLARLTGSDTAPHNLVLAGVVAGDYVLAGQLVEVPFGNPRSGSFSDIINSSTGRSWASEIYNPVPGVSPTAPANNDYKGGFSTDLITKDLGLASGVATSTNTPIPMGALAHQMYRTLKAHGLGNKDFSVIYDFWKNTKYN